MQLVTRVLLLAVTVLGASAWPRMADEQSLFRMVMAQVSSSMIDERALSPAETACLNAYNNATNHIGNNLSNSTNKCEDAANKTAIANNQSSNSTVNSIRTQLLTLQQNVQRCLNESDANLLTNCTTSYFSANLQLLDTTNSKSYQVQAESAANSTNANLKREACIFAAADEVKIQYNGAVNDYNSCVKKIAYQRDQTLQQDKPLLPSEQRPVLPSEQQPIRPVPAQTQSQSQVQSQPQSQSQFEVEDLQPVQQSEKQPIN
ncbi:putative mediator of RNA polymerase II transcription subunit 29 [Drosophila nasuta]|uniref:putative mediator of RNA polymerase II transcription subunit 29 n=1 Tax=Drosophila nasuta TaxID=42062 RepID=UPI00295F01EB|nr:putative mediator of RNA polymerase II transcription subunit 29 [Drosophila nasuta]